MRGRKCDFWERTGYLIVEVASKVAVEAQMPEEEQVVVAFLWGYVVVSARVASWWEETQMDEMQSNRKWQDGKVRMVKVNLLEMGAD